MAQELRTFSDIYSAVLETIKIQSGDTTTVNRVKRNVNMTYLNEVAPARNWKWLRRSLDIQMPAKITTGTVSITGSSTAITFSSGPSNSMVGARIRFQGHDEIYTILTHTAAATAAVLSVPFTGTTDTDATYTMWRDAIALPNDCREVVNVWHDYHGETMKPISTSELRQLLTGNPTYEEKPIYYSVGPYIDPTPNVSITSLPSTSTRLSVGYSKSIKFASSLTNIVSQGDRIRITGAGHYAYNIDEVVVAALSTTTNTDDTITYTTPVYLTQSSTADTGISVTSVSNEHSLERYRELILFPAIFEDDVTIHCEYSMTPKPLNNDSDEPLIPIEHRIILVHGALEKSWGRERNPEERSLDKQLFEQKLMQMSSEQEQSVDTGSILVSPLYLQGKRIGIKRRSSDFNRS